MTEAQGGTMKSMWLSSAPDFAPPSAESAVCSDNSAVVRIPPPPLLQASNRECSVTAHGTDTLFLDSSRSTQDSAGFGIRVLAVLHDLDAIDKHVSHSHCVLMPV